MPRFPVQGSFCPYWVMTPKTPSTVVQGCRFLTDQRGGEDRTAYLGSECQETPSGVVHFILASLSCFVHSKNLDRGVIPKQCHLASFWLRWFGDVTISRLIWSMQTAELSSLDPGRV